MNVELLEIRKRHGFIDNVTVTLRIFNRVVKTAIFRDLDGFENFEDKLKDPKWVQTCASYAVQKLLCGESVRRDTPENPLIEGTKFSLLDLLESA